MPRRLPRRSLLALRSIHAYRSKYGDAPTLRELAALSGIKSISQCSYLLARMDRRGLIQLRRVGRKKITRFSSTRITPKGLQLLRKPARGSVPPLDEGRQGEVSQPLGDPEEEESGTG